MRKSLLAFVRSEDGAVTVDWVVLTALIIGIQIVILIGTMRDSMVDVTDTVAAKVEEQKDQFD